MSLVVQRSGPADRSRILGLLMAARGDGLSADARARAGFVQGNLDDCALARFQSDLGVYVALDDSRLAGTAVVLRPGYAPSGPPAATMAEVAAAYPEVADRLFLYGPAAVAPPFRGRGVLTALLKEICTDLADRFDMGSAFVDGENLKSLAVHRHYGMDELSFFEIKARKYHVFTFPLTLFQDS